MPPEGWRPTGIMTLPLTPLSHRVRNSSDLLVWHSSCRKFVGRWCFCHGGGLKRRTTTKAQLICWVESWDATQHTADKNLRRKNVYSKKSDTVDRYRATCNLRADRMLCAVERRLWAKQKISQIEHQSSHNGKSNCCYGIRCHSPGYPSL